MKTTNMLVPINERELGELLATEPIDFKESKEYRALLDGNHQEYLDSVIEICTAIAAYLEAMVDTLIDNPKNEVCLKHKIVNVLDTIEVASKSQNDEVINLVTTGIFERIESVGNDETFNTILRNLRPASRMLWDQWMPLISSREPDPAKGIDISNSVP